MSTDEMQEWEIEDARQSLAGAVLRLANALRDACPGPHKFVEHRDALPAWCPACGRGQDGARYKDV